jgi:hypothetical protein
LRAVSHSNIIMPAIKTARVRVAGLLFLLPSNTVSTATPLRHLSAKLVVVKYH